MGLFILWPFWRLSGQFDELIVRQPSRLYARIPLVELGKPCDLDRMSAELLLAGYRRVEGGGERPPGSGRFRRYGDRLMVHLRSFPTPEGEDAGGIVEVRVSGRRTATLKKNGQNVESVRLEPSIVASYYGEGLEERRPIRLDRVPQDLVHAVLAAEDERFFRHLGISLRGVARAAWVNLRGGGIRQGGSTLTQQLVKNLYLTHERTARRKIEEAIFAVLVELRYSKREILEGYLNEIYLGSSGGVNVLGVGAASRAFFGKDAADLDLAESATLAGMISSPGAFSPIAHPEKSRARRDWVLDRLVELGLAEKERVALAKARPVAAEPETIVRRRAPFFSDAMAAEAERRFKLVDLADQGYALFSTLDLADQGDAQKAVEAGLKALDEGAHATEKRLETALVSVDPKSGGILAYVGGRDYKKSQFDRATQARRQAGSAFKPIVYAALFESHRGTPASFVEDSPLTVKLAGKPWSPKNDDGSFHGWVTVRSALEHSYNPATTRIALQVGMDEIVELAHKMGVESDMDPFPSVALGATALAPLELASVYATLAGGGVRPPIHGLAAVRDRYGKPVAGAALSAPVRVLSEPTTYLVTSVLQGVIDRGTGRGVRSYGVDGDLAGKTGTTNDRRDAWFAGYSSDRATVVWVGHDDNSPTRLSGARGALPIWSRFTAGVRPAGGFRVFAQPAGLRTAVIDPTTGQLANEYCPYVMTEVFRAGEVPTELCDRHTDLSDDGEDVLDFGVVSAHGGDPASPVETERDRRHPFRRWLRRVFGSEGQAPPPEPNTDGGGSPPPPQR